MAATTANMKAMKEIPRSRSLHHDDGAFFNFFANKFVKL